MWNVKWFLFIKEVRMMSCWECIVQNWDKDSLLAYLGQVSLHGNMWEYYAPFLASPRDVDGTALFWVITQRVVVKITTTSCVIRNFQAYGNNPNKSKWYSYRNTSCLNEMNASCRSVQNLPSYSPLSANSKTKKCRNIIFGVVIHWRQIWYLTRR